MTQTHPKTNVIFCACLLFWLGACQQQSQATHSQPKSEDFKIVKGDFSQAMTLSGELDFLIAEKLLTPRTPTWSIGLTSLLTDGQSVKEGDIVAEFDKASLLQSIDEQKNTLLDARAKVSTAKNEKKTAMLEANFQLKKAELELQKAELDANLPKDLQSEVEYSNKQLALARAENAVQNANMGLKTTRQTTQLDLDDALLELNQHESEFSSAIKTLKKITLKAPKDGVWVVAQNQEQNRKLRVGDTLWPSAPVGKISDLNKLIVKAWLHDVDAGSITEDMKAMVVLDAYPNKQYEGKIVSIALMASPFKKNSIRRKFDVIVELKEPDTTIMRPGLSASVSIETGQMKDVHLIPRLALTFSKDSVKGMTQDGNTVDIKVDACNEAYCALSKDFDVGLLQGSQQ